MLKGQLLHPQILGAIARAGHGSRILISDGNYPHSTTRGPNAELVYLNLSPGLVSVTDVLRAVLSIVPIEQAAVMETLKSGSYAMLDDPPVWNEFRKALADAGTPMDLTSIERFNFYRAGAEPDVCLTIASGDQRVYANLLLTIGVVKPPAKA